MNALMVGIGGFWTLPIHLPIHMYMNIQTPRAHKEAANIYI
jgi:hypothetical protein